MMEIHTHRKKPFVNANEILNYYGKMYIFLHAFLFDYNICVFGRTLYAYNIRIRRYQNQYFVQMRVTML
jgi:hypothetical protein